MQGSHAEERASLPHGWGPRALGFLPFSPSAGLSTAPKCCPSPPRLPSTAVLYYKWPKAQRVKHHVLCRVTVLYRGGGGHTHDSGKVLDERASVGACVCVGGSPPGPSIPPGGLHSLNTFTT